jgi:undecaprenyl-diphosphatase
MQYWEALLVFDTTLSRMIASAAMGSEQLRFAAFVAAELLPFVAGLLMLWLWYRPDTVARHHGNRKAVVLASMASIIALAIKTVTSATLMRERPFIQDGSWPHLALSVDPGSFPSAHTMLMVTAAASVYLSGARRVGWVLAVFAMLVAWGRVATGVHFLGDVAAGAVLGLIIAWLLHRESSSIKRYLPNQS